MGPFLAQPYSSSDPAGFPVLVSRTPVNPFPVEAVAVTTSLALVVAVGGVVSVMGMVHLASVMPQIPVPAVAEVSARLAEAVWPVSIELTNTSLVVLV